MEPCAKVIFSQSNDNSVTRAASRSIYVCCGAGPARISLWQASLVITNLKLNWRNRMVNASKCVPARGWSLALVGLLSLSTLLSAQQVQHYKQTNLVSDTPGMASLTDANLVNPWGLSRSSGSPWWISDNGPGLATVHGATGTPAALVVTIPPADSTTGASGTPTGQVSNGTTSFALAAGFPARFIFVTEDGTVSGWNSGVNATTAVIMVNTKSASVFKGVAVATISDPYSPTLGALNFLYVADFRKGHIAVYDANFQRIHMGHDAFRDERIPRGFAPFNVQDIGGNLYVAFAKQDSAKHDEVDGAGIGFVDVFSPTGRLLNRLESGPWFNAPWGMAQAPTDFGAYSHDILVGQFGSGEILVFDPVTGHFKGRLLDSVTNAPIAIDGLWGIAFGSGTGSGAANALYFTAGPGGEQHGLFGTITAVENVLGGDL
jgi:uncharacterized protein (TIGR03118 family)